VRIAIDAMGGDFGPPVTVPAALCSLALHPALELVLIGAESQIAPLLSGVAAADRRRVSVRHCTEVVEMADRPSHALRNKRQSSMRIAVDLLDRGEVAACVSAGNTGALMAIGYSVLKTAPAIDRPAICAAIPTRLGHSYLLDLGANVDNCPEHLHQFALMGTVLSQALDNVAEPRVMLLNIGEEVIKGNEQVRVAARLIEQDPRIRYTGYLEADRLFDGSADVVVCDGFVGNVALKAVEGTARFIADKSSQVFRHSPAARIIGWFARPLLRRLLAEVNPEAYNGAFFLGLRGVLVKSHGRASANGFHLAIEKAIMTVENRMIEQLQYKLEVMA